ncbi:MAG TPA: DUF5916 domain-containing protein [Vicinamibacterales bacterium]|nr:DUF5916 domain-containing protein [Vicinamibacterales bacterium]
MRRRALPVWLLAGAVSPALAQPAAEPGGKTIHALRITTPIRVDGRLDEAAWRAAEAISDFVQQEPRVGEPVTERTEVRVLLDSGALYIGVACYDRTPAGIIARERRRDNPLLDDDRFEVVLDTFHDHRNAFHFAINPLGTQYDALITDEGQDVNVEWDERWWAAAVIGTEGWTAEIRIPFAILRSRAGLDVFGVNFKRFIRRKNETAQWSGWDRDFTFLQVSQAGHLAGVEGVRTGLKLRVKPYVLGGFQDGVSGGHPALDLRRDIGLETLKVSLTPALTAELTLNTDFAQAEVDEAVVNLTRFPLFFPEKREFFLERAGIFEFGLGGRRGGTAERNLQMFFSRRIGLTDDRRPVPILGGGKLIGRAGGFDLGLLSVQTGRFEGAPGSNYAVFRAKRNVLARSNVGLFLSNRQSGRRDFNRVVGADANFTLFKNTDIQGFLARSVTAVPAEIGPAAAGGRERRAADEMAGRLKYNWLSDLYEVFVEHLYVGSDFQHDIGFVRRRGIHRSDAVFVWEPRPGRYNIRNFVFRGELTYLTDVHYTPLTRERIFQATTRFQNDDALRFNATETFDRLDRPFEIAEGVVIPAGDYHFVDTWGEVESSGERRLVMKLRAGGGGFYSGRRRYVRVSPAWRPSPLLSVESAYELNDVTLREGAFATHVINARVNVNLSNRWLTTTLAQYDSASRRHVLYCRLNYIFRPGDDLFVVYTQSRQTGPHGEPPDRALTVKLTYSLDF